MGYVDNQDQLLTFWCKNINAIWHLHTSHKLHLLLVIYYSFRSYLTTPIITATLQLPKWYPHIHIS